MTSIDELMARNVAFTAQHFTSGLQINPSGRLMVIGCVDPRVDPARVLGLQDGEAAVIRNVGGRVTPATLKTLAMLGRVGQANGGGAPGVGWNLIVLHHTDCGMTDLAAFPHLLADYFEIAVEDLPGKAVSDPHESVKVDVALLRQAPALASAFVLSGLVYDVDTGHVEAAVAPAPVR